MTKLLNVIVVVFMSLFCLYGCAQQPRIAHTQSGSPEILINSEDIDLVKSEIIANMMSKGFTDLMSQE